MGEDKVNAYRKLDGVLEHDHYLKVHAEKDHNFFAPHSFQVRTEEGDLVSTIHFQEGTIPEAGINGVTNEALLIMVKERLASFQESKFRCRENAVALTNIEEALMWLNRRTKDRQLRSVEGKHEV